MGEGRSHPAPLAPSRAAAEALRYALGAGDTTFACSEPGLRNSVGERRTVRWDEAFPALSRVARVRGHVGCLVTKGVFESGNRPYPWSSDVRRLQ